MANKNLREFIKSISENIDLGEFKIESIPEVELPENFNDDFHNQFLTMTAAKNNPELMGHFKGKYLSSADLKAKNNFIADGGTEEEFNILKASEPDSLKLIDLVASETRKRKSTTNSGKPDKEFEAYKKETIKQFEELKAAKENLEATLQEKIIARDSEWENRFKTSKVNEVLSGIKFDSSIPSDDLKLIINSKLNQSNYLIKMQEGQFKVYKKDAPDSLALKDGKELQLEDVISEISKPYTAKNDQEGRQERRVVTVQTDAADNGDGRFIPGHKDYGKKF